MVVPNGTDSSAWLPSLGTFQLTLYGAVVSTPSEVNVPVAQSTLVFEHSKNSTDATPLPPSVAVAPNVVGLGKDALMLAGGAVIVTDGGMLSTRMFELTTCAEFPASSVALARTSYRPSPAGSAVVFQDDGVGVHVASLWSLYSNVTGGLAGEASLALAVSGTMPLTKAPPAGLEKVRDGGVLSTRAVIGAEVVELPAASVAVTRRS